MRLANAIDLTGLRFDRLLVIERVPSHSPHAVWRCKCDCGEERNVIGQNLRLGRQKSCGCLDRERKITHGESSRSTKTSEYTAWKAMKDRCYFSGNTYYYLYGGRGIKVCDRWLHSFENFLEDMGRRPSSKHSLDRIKANGNYEPSNCKWSTGSEQIINQRMRSDNTSGHKGISWDKRRSTWHAYLNIKGQKRINLGNFEHKTDAIKSREEAEIKYHNKQPS